MKPKLDELIEAVKPAEAPKRNFHKCAHEDLGEMSDEKAYSTYGHYRTAIEKFLEVCGRTESNLKGKVHLEDLDFEDMHTLSGP